MKLVAVGAWAGAGAGAAPKLTSPKRSSRPPKLPLGAAAGAGGGPGVDSGKKDGAADSGKKDGAADSGKRFSLG